MSRGGIWSNEYVIPSRHGTRDYRAEDKREKAARIFRYEVSFSCLGIEPRSFHLFVVGLPDDISFCNPDPLGRLSRHHLERQGIFPRANLSKEDRRNLSNRIKLNKTVMENLDEKLMVFVNFLGLATFLSIVGYHFVTGKPNLLCIIMVSAQSINPSAFIPLTLPTSLFLYLFSICEGC
jgi:hypothetical protein